MNYFFEIIYKGKRVYGLVPMKTKGMMMEWLKKTYPNYIIVRLGEMK